MPLVSILTILFSKFQISPADENGDTYIVSFDIKEKPNDTLVWAVHTSSAPYDMAVMTDNCRRVKKSPPVVKNMPVTDSTIAGDGLAGNTLVISGDNSEVRVTNHCCGQFLQE